MEMTQEDIAYYKAQEKLASELLTPADEITMKIRIDELFQNVDFKNNNKLPFIMNYINWEKDINKFLEESDQMLFKAHPNKCVSVDNTFGSIGYTINQMKFSRNIAEYVAQQMWLPLLFIHNWEVYKQVYTFEENSLQFLMESAEYKKVPVDILTNNLPYDSFYIDNEFNVDNEHYVGAIINKVKREDNSNWLGFYMIRKNKDFDFRYAFLPLERGKGSIKELMDLPEVVHFNLDGCLTKLLSLVLYLCSFNKEIRPLKEKNNYEKNREKHREKVGVKVEELGFVFGATIKMNMKQVASTQHQHTGSHSSKRPHTRCAHYHHYWTGSKDSPDRKLIIKFIPPLFINGNSNVAVIHKVKQ